MRKDQAFDKKTLKAKLQEKITRAEGRQQAYAARNAFSPELESGKAGFTEVPIPSPARKLRVGQLLSIYSAASDQELAAAVMKIDEDIWLEIIRPIPDGSLKRGQRIGIEAWDDQGSYTFHSVVQETFSDPRPRIRVSCPRMGLAVQRRKSDRLRTSVPFSFTVLESAKLAGQQILHARTRDISLGGMAFHSNLPLKRGDRLKVNITLLPSPHQIEVMGRVIRSTELVSTETDMRLIAIQFVDLPASEYNTLLLFLAKNHPGCEGTSWVG